MTSHKIQVLRNRLDSLSKNYNNRNYYSSLLHNSDIEKDILCHLKTADEDYIIEFFNKFTNCIAGNFDIVREACLKMLSILFDYFISIGLDRSSIERKKDAVKTDFNGLKRKRDMVIYVSQLYFNLFQPGEAEGKHSYYHTLISSIKSYIKDNCCDTMFSVTRVADEFNFSEDYIGKLFKQYTDITISNYIAVVRLENAVNLLVNTVDSIKDISGTLGYGSPQYFAQVFKEKYHMTPTEYRIRMQRISKRVIDRLR